MAKNMSPEEIVAQAEKKKLQDEKKKLKKEQKEQRKEAKRRAKEIAQQEEALIGDEEGHGVMTFFATVLIVVLWLAVICIIVKLDIGGFGSTVLKPLLKDVPVVNMILPGNSLTETTDPESYGGYSSLKDAVEQIRVLEMELESAQLASKSKDEELVKLKEEVLRLQEFEKKQVEFQRIRTEFYEEVIYADKGPGVDEYIKYYQSMDETTAEYIYKQVIIQQEETKEVKEYAAAYSSMKPAAAAAIFEKMESNLSLAARILGLMDSEARGDILAAMDPEIAAKLTKIMDPES